jgi:acyl-coenzyme A synthetase/AMP-(fatty) acid ligase
MTSSITLGPLERPLFTRQTNTDVVTADKFLAQANGLSEVLSVSGLSCINLCEDRANFALGFCAALLANIQNLLPTNQLPKTIIRLVKSVEGCFILTDSKLSPELEVQLKSLDVPRVDIASAFDTQTTAKPVPTGLTKSLAAATVFTSGSTGEPVAITKQWRTLCGTTALLQRRFLSQEQLTSIVATVPAQHMYGLEMSVMMALRGNCNVHSSRPFFPADIVQALESMPAPRLLVTTPIHMKTLVRSGLALPELYGVISATAPLDHDLAEAAQKNWNAPVREIYGCSEGGSLASRTTVGDGVWFLLDGVQLSRQDGKLRVVAPHLDCPVELQDELEVLSESQFRFIGRGIDMLNIGGKRASLMQLNRELLAVEGVEDGIFFLRSRSGREDRLAALVVTERESREIARQLANVIDPVFLPRPLKKVQRIPRDSVGKSTFDMLQEVLAETFEND